MVGLVPSDVSSYLFKGCALKGKNEQRKRNGEKEGGGGDEAVTRARAAAAPAMTSMRAHTCTKCQ